jgi:exopolysaccharide production protein ExoZ
MELGMLQPPSSSIRNYFFNQFELARGGAAQNVLPMEGLRGFAVFLVFLVHYVSVMSPWITAHSGLSRFSDAIHTVGNSGVDLFFVLSGYLIYGSLIKRQQAFLPFIRKRIARIYPAFCVVFAIYLLLSILSPKDSRIPAVASDAVLYILQNFLLLPGLFPIEPIITVAWSLSYEMFYYLVIPLAVFVFGLRQRSPRWRVMFFLAIAVAITVYCALNTGHVRLIMFIAGILLYEAGNNGKITVPGKAYALAALIAGLVSTLIPFPGSASFALKTAILAASFFLVCFSCFSEADNMLARTFSWTPLRWLGNMSYSYYLLHGLALKIGFFVLLKAMPTVSNQELVFFVLLAPMFVVTLVPSAVLFILIERPMSLVAKPEVKGTANNSEAERPQRYG